jgi:hypothetical protein
LGIVDYLSIKDEAKSAANADAPASLFVVTQHVLHFISAIFILN